MHAQKFKKLHRKEIIEHEAIIREIKDSVIIADFVSKSACVSCQVKGMCSTSDIQQKTLEVVKPKEQSFEIGQTITVFINQSLGIRALFFGYLLPFLVLMFTLILMLTFTKKEGLSALVSLFILLPYYSILYFNKEKISQRYNFFVKNY